MEVSGKDLEKSAWVDLHAGNMTVRADNWQLLLIIQITLFR